MKQSFSEVIKLHDAIFYNVDYHQRRIDKTQNALGRNKINLREALSSIPASAQKGLFKCRIVYSDLMESIEFIPYSFPTIKSVAVIIDNNIEYSLKSTDRSHLNRLRNEAGSDEIIIIKNGLVTDGFATNLVFETKDGKLYTPDSYLLAGTKRQLLIDKGQIIERRITIDDIKTYTRIRFINAMIDLEDNIGFEISKIENKSI